MKNDTKQVLGDIIGVLVLVLWFVFLLYLPAPI